MSDPRPLADMHAVMATLNVKSRSSIYKKLRNDPDFPAPIQVIDKLEWFMDEIEDYKVTRPRRQYAVREA